MATTEDFPDGLAAAVAEAFKTLLSEKHLYQSVEVNDAFIARIAAFYAKISGAGLSKIEQFKKPGAELFNGLWTPINASNKFLISGVPRVSTGSAFQYTKILTFCHHCKGRWPFNSFGDSEFHEQGKFSPTEQWFSVSYECQQCKGEAVRFLVRRSGKKLTLSGRDPIESVPTLKDLPKQQAQFFSSAVIAHNAGQTLAGIFFLRVFIEQFWNSTTEVAEAIKENSRLSGEDRGSIYNKTLPEDFKQRFPSLLEIYSKLSGAMHEATADTAVFDQASVDIVRHFEARRIFYLKISETIEPAFPSSTETPKIST